MIAAGAAVLGRRRIAEGRMMGRQQQRAGEFLLLDQSELGAEEIDLDIRDRPFPFLVEIGNHAGIFQRVAEQPDDPDKRRIQREIHAGLSHRGPVQRARFGGDDGLPGAEISLKNRQRRIRRLGAGHHEGIVIAGNRKDRRWIIAEWIVELIVIIPRLAEIIDDIAEMIEERGTVALRR